MNKILIIGLLLFLLVGSLLVYNNISNKVKPVVTNIGQYQGPVQEGYNENLFRETGRYEKIGVNNG
jgi:hypothetical protein